ncbi:hypothetical protein BDZ88DRAFT_453848 [Geranomyces variabilis]|nr:hypothetical protein BDZ88DRAFT_453848 [Geranomyces variabilis]KAJ3140768.1 hypothetical protein HDU90_008073 [Geranomyces variabilis]
MDWRDASALWFVNPAQQPLAWLDYLSAQLQSQAKMKPLGTGATCEFGTSKHKDSEDNIMVAARPAAKVGVELVGDEMAIRRKRLNATMQGNDEGTAEDVGVGGSSDIVPLAKRVRTLSTPHKPTLPRTSVEFAKRKHRTHRHDTQRPVDLMDEMHMKVFCPLSVTALFDDLSKMHMGPEVGKYSGQAMSKTFADAHKERIHHMALATTADFYNTVRYKLNACFQCTTPSGLSATKDINCMMLGTDDATTYAVDVIGVFGGDNAELLFLEQSGGSCFEKCRPHAKDDSITVVNESINGLRARLCKFLDVPVELAKKSEVVCNAANREYFRALFNGPWKSQKTADGLLRLVEPGALVTASEMQLLLDFAYLPVVGQRLTQSAANVIEAKAVARAMQVPALDRAVTVLLEKNPVIGTWKNVEPLLHMATKQPRWESMHSLCAQFLSSKPGAHWTRVWYLAEKYDLPLLLSEKHYGNLPHNPWNDSFFAKLSDNFRSRLLLARVQNTWFVSYNVRGATSEPFKLGQKCGSNYPSSEFTRVYAPDALTTRHIAATVAKRFPYHGSSSPSLRECTRRMPLRVAIYCH